MGTLCVAVRTESGRPLLHGYQGQGEVLVGCVRDLHQPTADAGPLCKAQLARLWA